MKKAFVILIVIIALFCASIAQAIKPEDFIKRYNADVVKQTELIDWKDFIYKGEEAGKKTYKSYIVENNVLAEVICNTNGDVYSFGILILFTTEQEAQIKSKHFLKVANHIMFAGSPSLQFGEIIANNIKMFSEIVFENKEFAEMKTKESDYKMIYGNLYGTESLVFMCYPTN